MADYFCSEPPYNLPFEGTGIGYKSTVKLKVFAQPMHWVFIIKYCILLKTSKLVMYDNEIETKEKKILTRDKIEPQHTHQFTNILFWNQSKE